MHVSLSSYLQLAYVYVDYASVVIVYLLLLFFLFFSEPYLYAHHLAAVFFIAKFPAE